MQWWNHPRRSVCGRDGASVRYGMRVGHICFGLVPTIVFLADTRAEACSCNRDRAVGVWPLDGTVGASVDTPLVVAATDLQHVTPELVAEDGTVVGLQEQRRLVPPGEPSCVRSSYAFLTAAQELAPNTRYSLIAHFDNENDVERRQPVKFDSIRSFVTGTERRNPAPPEVRLSLFGALLRPEVGARAGMLLDVYVETAGMEPLFVLARGERNVLVHDLDPVFSGARSFRVGLGAVECAALTIFDVTGTTVADRVLCEPSKCAVATAIGESDCGEESYPGVGASWQSLPEGCDREALLQNAEEHPMEIDGAAPVDVWSEPDVSVLESGEMAGVTTSISPPAEESNTRQPRRAVDGCGLSVQRTSGGVFAVIGLLLAMVMARTLRRAT